jgi:hypothetical protein
MKRLWLFGILALLMIALLAQSASAAIISLDADISSITLTKRRNPVTLTNTNDSSVSVSGSAYYTKPDSTGIEDFSGGSSSSSPSVNHTGTFLQSLAGSINGTHLSASLDGVATYSDEILEIESGRVTETVADTAYYTTSGVWWLLPRGKLTIPYSYTYSLQNNNTSAYFYAVTFTVKAAVYVNGVSVITTTLLNFSESTLDPEVALPDIAPTSYSGILEKYFFPIAGAHDVRVVLYETMTGYTDAPVPPSALLLGSGLLGLGLLGWRRKIG